MAPSVVYTVSRQRSPTAPGDLFTGKKFWIAQRCPTRSDFVKLVCWNGGQVVPLEKHADYLIHDHARKDAPPGALSYRFIEQSVRDAEIKDPDDHLCGPPAGSMRQAGLAQPTGTGRVSYSTADDVELYQWVKLCESRGLQTKGNKIYQMLAERNPRHPAQSWRDRYLKILVNKPPTGAPVVAAKPHPEQPSDLHPPANARPISQSRQPSRATAESDAKSRKRKPSPTAASPEKGLSSAPKVAKTHPKEPSLSVKRRSSPVEAESKNQRKPSPVAVVPTKASSSSAPEAVKTRETDSSASVKGTGFTKEVERERKQPENTTSSLRHASKAVETRVAESPASAQRKSSPAATESEGLQPFVASKAEVDQSPQIKKTPPEQSTAVARPPFTVRDLDRLMEVAGDVQNIRRHCWKQAWRVWANAYPPFTADEWEEFWETTVSPIWLEQEDRGNADRKAFGRIYEKSWDNWTAQQGMDAPVERWVQFFNAEVIPLFRKHEAAQVAIEQEIKTEKDDAKTTPAPVPHHPLAGIQEAAAQDAPAEQVLTTTDVEQHNFGQRIRNSSPHSNTDAPYGTRKPKLQLQDGAEQVRMASAEPRELGHSPPKNPSDAEVISPISTPQLTRSSRKRVREEDDIVETAGAPGSVKRLRNDTPDNLVETAQESVEVAPKNTAAPEIMAEEQQCVDISSGVPESSYVSSDREPEPDRNPVQKRQLPPAPGLGIRSNSELELPEEEPELSEEESELSEEEDPVISDQVEQGHNGLIVPVGRIREVVQGLSLEQVDYLLCVFRERPSAPSRNRTGGMEELYMHIVHFFSQVNSEPTQDVHTIGAAFEDLGLMELFDVDQDEESEASIEDDDQSDERVQEICSSPPQLPHQPGESIQEPSHDSSTRNGGGYSAPEEHLPSPSQLLPRQPEQQVKTVSPNIDTEARVSGRETTQKSPPSPQSPQTEEQIHKASRSSVTKQGTSRSSNRVSSSPPKLPQKPGQQALERDPQPPSEPARSNPRFSSYLQRADHKAYITSRTAPPYGYTEGQVIRALHATCMHGSLSDEVLRFMRSHHDAVGPANKKGIWTAEDDRDLRSVFEGSRKRVERKHGGEKTCEDRRKYLRLFG